jgi:hypothetical protein
MIDSKEIPNINVGHAERLDDRRDHPAEDKPMVSRVLLSIFLSTSAVI